MGMGSRIRKARGKANTVQDGSVDLQLGIGVDRNSQPCIKGHYSKQGFLTLEDPLANSRYTNYMTLYKFFVFFSSAG
jgi:hypothetical protein